MRFRYLVILAGVVALSAQSASGCDSPPDIGLGGAGGHAGGGNTNNSSASGGSSGTDGGIGGSTGAGDGGDAPSCADVLTPGGIGDLHSTVCIGCIEDHCCEDLAACGADPVCSACLDDPLLPDCNNSGILGILVICAEPACQCDSPPCKAGSSQTSCLDLTATCNHDGVCDAKFGGNERCQCDDCVANPTPDCAGTCNHDGVCDYSEDYSDSCTCSDCWNDPGCNTACNFDGFCDQYAESCECADCADAPLCKGGAGGAGGGGGSAGHGG